MYVVGHQAKAQYIYAVCQCAYRYCIHAVDIIGVIVKYDVAGQTVRADMIGFLHLKFHALHSYNVTGANLRINSGFC